MTTSWDEIQEALMTALQSSGIPLGSLQAYPRWAPSWEEYLNIFAVEVDGQRQIRGVELTRKSASSSWHTFGRSVKRIYRFTLVFHLGLNDAGESAQELQNLVDRVMDYLDNYVMELTGYEYGPIVGPSSLSDFVETDFHGVLSNHAQVDVPIEFAKVV
jgi:hypothetical protein